LPLKQYILPTVLALAALVALQGMLRRRRRAGAWPDRLEDLHTEYAPWWLLRVAGAATGLAVLWFGIADLGAWKTAVGASVMGGAMMVLVHRRWDRALAYLGLALITLAVCAAITYLVALFIGEAECASRQWGCVLYGLATMTFLWLWLGRFWSQQLSEGSPWTTAGRMVVPAARAGAASAGLALLVAGRLAVWPGWPPTGSGSGNSCGAWLEGGGVVMLAIVLWNRARAARDAWLYAGSVLAVLIGGTYCWLRG
jgi:hypothetical protein